MGCKCSLSLSNTGVPGCASLQDVEYRDILVPLVADDGTENNILAADVFDDDYIQDRINHADPSKRWYPVPESKNVEGERAVSEKESFNDGTSIVTRDGVRNYTGLIIQQDHNFYSQIVGFKCSNNLGVFKVTRSEQLVGKLEDNGDLSPIPIQKGSFDPILVKSTDAAVSKVKINYEYATSFKDEDFGMLLPEDMDDDVDLFSLNGLITVQMKVVGTPATTGFVIDLYSKHGSAKTGTPIKGLVLADFDVYNETDSASTVPTSVTESTSIPGRYTFAGPFTPALTSADELQVTLDSTVTGYDDSVMATVDITIA